MAVSPKRNYDTWAVTYNWTAPGSTSQEYAKSKIHHVRGPARNGYIGK